MKLLKIVVMSLALTGCVRPDGLVLDSGDIEKCKAEGCAAWTAADLNRLAQYFYGRGVAAGIAADQARSKSGQSL